LLREKATDLTACDTFDYNDLNAYLLVVLGLAAPEKDQIQQFQELVRKSQDRVPVPLRDITTLAKKSPLVTLSQSADLTAAIESFASGVHRILVCKDGTKDGTKEVVGILSQLRLIRFLWDYAANFPAIYQLYSMHLRDLDIGTQATISIKYVLLVHSRLSPC